MEQEVSSTIEDSANTGGSLDKMDMDAAMKSIAQDLDLGEGAKDNGEDAGHSVEAKAPEAETPEVKAETPQKTPPKSWAADKHAKFAALDPEVQDYILQREAQDEKWMQDNRQYLSLAKEVNQAATPYAAMLRAHNLSPAQALDRFLALQYRLETSTGPARTEQFVKLAKDFGVDLGALQTESEQAYVDPRTSALEKTVQQLQQEREQERATQQQHIARKVQSEVEAFFNDPANAYATDVEAELLAFINQGMSLKDAYEKAIWANPVTRARENARINAEAQKAQREADKKAAEEAKKARGVKPKGVDVPALSGDLLMTLDDTLRSKYRAIQSRVN